MDNLTHALVGAALARTGLDRLTPLATATLVVAANAPDVDVLAYARGPMVALAFRRGITHGVPALAVLPLAVAGAMLAWDRLVRRRRSPDAAPARFGPLLLLSFLGVLTHPALDWMNTYGMRWWLPLDGRWSYGDSLFIIDPWIWLLLGGAVALGGAASRWASAGWVLLGGAATALVLATGFVSPAAKVVWCLLVAGAVLARALGRPGSPTGRALLARSLTAAAALYILVMVVVHRAAADDVREQLLGGIGLREEVLIAPRPASLLVSDVLVVTPAGYIPGVHDWRAVPTFVLATDQGLSRVTIAPELSDDEALAAVTAARLDPDAVNYLVWSRYPFYRVDPAEGGYDVRVGDARYTSRGGSLAGITVFVPADR